MDCSKKIKELRESTGMSGKGITDMHRRMCYDYWSIIFAWKN